MFLRLENYPSTRLIGLSKEISVASLYLTGEIWKKFIPVKNEIKNTIGTYMFSMSVYPKHYNFKNFDLNAPYKKWAAVTVSNFENVPAQLETFVIPDGLYAVFLHKGSQSEGEKTFRYIYNEWIPSSGYEVDSRPHFEILGHKYINNSPDSEEEIFIPIRKI